MAKGRPAVLAGLDLGTSKTALVVAEAGNGCPRLLGMGLSPSLGVQRGIITDVESAAKSIGQALEKAEKTAGAKVASVYVSYNGADTAVRDCLVHKETLDGIPADEKCLHLLAPPLAADRFEHGQEARARAITAKAAGLESVLQSARLAGVRVREVVYGPLAGAAVVLSQTEREFGSLLIDLGAGTTSVSIFNRGRLRETAVFPVGGEHLAGDLAIGLRTSLARAEEILKNFVFGETGPDGHLEIPGLDGEDSKRVPHSAVKMIIEARVSEILELLAGTVRGFGHAGLLPGGAVLYGGVSRLSGLAGLAEGKLHLPVKIGPVEAPEPALDHPYANALGLVRYACNHLLEEGRGFRTSRQVGIMEKLLSWLQGPVKIK